MNDKKKRILTILLVLLVVLFGGVSIYVATQLSSRQAVAPNAPTSKPKAAESSGIKGRFRVTIDGTAGNWLEGVTDANNKTVVTYSDYTVSSTGTYKFEAQVSTTP